MKQQYRIKSICSLTAVVAAGFIYAASQSPELTEGVSASDMPAGQTAARELTDSLSPGQIAVNAMTEEYKVLKELQYEGEEESSFYPRTLEMYLTASKALDLAENEDQKMQVKNVLIDINGLLLKGAFFYSNAGDQKQLASFARAYIDSQRLPIFSDGDFKRDPRIYPTLVYVAASDSYNSGNYDLAKEYFDIYLSTGEEKMRHQVAHSWVRPASIPKTT